MAQKLIRSSLASAAVVALVVALLATSLNFGEQRVDAQTASSDSEQSVRVIARVSESGRIEFGLRSADGDQFPRLRFFPTGITHNRWLRTSPITLASGETVRIIARISPGDGRIEFGIRIADSNVNRLPSSRYFPSSVSHNRWLRSSPIEVPVANVSQPADADTTPPAPTTDDPPADDPPTTSGDDPAPPADDHERIVGGHRDGLIVQDSILGDPDASVLIVEYGDPF